MHDITDILFIVALNSITIARKCCTYEKFTVDDIPFQFKGCILTSSEDTRDDIDLFFIFGCLTPLSAIFQLYHGDQFQWWKKLEYPERTTDHGQATDKLYHLWLRVECTLFVIYTAGREPTPYWRQACMSCQVIQLPNSLSHSSPGMIQIFNQIHIDIISTCSHNES